MVKISTLALIFIIMLVMPAVAHHPTEDMLDPELFEMIDDMVDGTPHGDMEEDDFGARITGITVEDADRLVFDGLLDVASELDGEVTITITFPDDNPMLETLMEEGDNDPERTNHKRKWSEWDRPVEIKIDNK